MRTRTQINNRNSDDSSKNKIEAKGIKKYLEDKDKKFTMNEKIHFISNTW